MAQRAQTTPQFGSSRRPLQKQYPIAMVDLFYREAVNYEIPWHTYPYEQWYCVIDGNVEIEFTEGSIVLGHAQSTIIPAGIVRRLSGRRPVRYLIAAFDNGRMDLAGMACAATTCPTDARPDLYALVREIRSNPRNDREDLLLTLVIRLLFALCREVKPAPAKAPASTINPGSQQALAARVDAYLRQHLALPVARADVAKHVALSSSHLARVYRASTGKTLKTRLTELRLEQACALLCESDIPITRVALDVGFNSFSHFSQLFRRTFGVSPSSYRRAGGKLWR